MGDNVSCNAPFDPPPDFSVDKADMVETITQVCQVINNNIQVRQINRPFHVIRELNASLVPSSSCCSITLRWQLISGGSS